MNVIEVFADVACPFTHVGLRRLVERRQQLGRDDVVLRVRAWPLELVNGAPLDRDLIAEEVDALKAQVAPDLFSAFDPNRFPATSLPALGLTAAAYAENDAVGERVALALRHALFEEGRDVADGEVLAEVATTAAIAMPTAGHRDAVRADWEEGKQRGVMGSPHFFVGDRNWFCPTLDISHEDGRLRVARDEAGLRAFLESCFGEGTSQVV